MKTLILAGGFGSRLGNITESIPKPMVTIGGKPVLWHIMKIYSHFGVNEFVILLGYKGFSIKQYFFNYHMMNNDFTINLADNNISYRSGNNVEHWTVTLVDTGIATLKGGRIKKAEPYLKTEINMLTYGDGVADVNLKELLRFHKAHGKMLTLTGVRPPSRFGELKQSAGLVSSFEEKPQISSGMINGGFMVFNKKLFSYLTPQQDCDFEFGILEELAKKGEIMVYEHDGFWACVDTERDLKHLNKLWDQNRARWKVW
ncbi:glucose-1-phosphate cytidylyltransferase [candidate division CSSED10-310 bacterium]|uniref:Glucose-1-phosphate cytidylyltransferase n=1 Tax=candidate division CSSED10-310 bacterium TaxID=2855610 RepID=A0ABV6YS70_UNCC1